MGLGLGLKLGPVDTHRGRRAVLEGLDKLLGVVAWLGLGLAWGWGWFGVGVRVWVRLGLGSGLGLGLRVEG